MVFELMFMVSNSEVVSFCPSETFPLLRADSLKLQETRPSTLGRSGRLEAQMSESTTLAQWTCAPVSRPALLRSRLPRHLGTRNSDAKFCHPVRVNLTWRSTETAPVLYQLFSRPIPVPRYVGVPLGREVFNPTSTMKSNSILQHNHKKSIQ